MQANFCMPLRPYAASFFVSAFSKGMAACNACTGKMCNCLRFRTYTYFVTALKKQQKAERREREKGRKKPWSKFFHISSVITNYSLCIDWTEWQRTEWKNVQQSRSIAALRTLYYTVNVTFCSEKTHRCNVYACVIFLRWELRAIRYGLFGVQGYRIYFVRKNVLNVDIKHVICCTHTHQHKSKRHRPNEMFIMRIVHTNIYICLIFLNIC